MPGFQGSCSHLGRPLYPLRERRQTSFQATAARFRSAALQIPAPPSDPCRVPASRRAVASRKKTAQKKKVQKKNQKSRSSDYLQFGFEGARSFDSLQDRNHVARGCPNR